MSRKFKLKYIAQEIGVSKSHASLLLRGRRNATWRVAKKLGALTNSDPVIWIDEEMGPADKRQLIILHAEIEALGE